MTSYDGDLLDLGDGAEGFYLGADQLVSAADGDSALEGFSAGYVVPFVPFSIDDRDVWRWRGSVSAWYSLTWIVLGTDMPWSPLRMPFTAGPDLTLGSTATPTEIASVKRQILKWKSPHAYPVKVILRFRDLTKIVPDVVLLGQHGLTMPFTQFVPPIPYCTWAIGKTMNDTLHSMPFTPGGYQVDDAA